MHVCVRSVLLLGIHVLDYFWILFDTLLKCAVGVGCSICVVCIGHQPRFLGNCLVHFSLGLSWPMPQVTIHHSSKALALGTRAGREREQPCRSASAVFRFAGLWSGELVPNHQKAILMVNGVSNWFWCFDIRLYLRNLSKVNCFIALSSMVWFQMVTL